MIDISLGINTGFAVNRYPVAKEWMKVVVDAGLKRVQITADMVDPRNPKSFIEEEINSILDASDCGRLAITSAFTGALTRLNLFGHPNQAVRDFWFQWYKQFIDISAKLGAASIGGHLSILSLSDDGDLETRSDRLGHIIGCWVELSKYASDRGIPCMIWEPMSISREFGETLDAASEIQDRFDNITGGGQIKLCLDVDHGDVTSKNSDDTDPYAWMNRFLYATHCIHLKQSLPNKGGHWPFTPEYNTDGSIQRTDFISYLQSNFRNDVELFLELSFRERNPVDFQASEHTKQSVEYWAGEEITI
jgi:hypothetical protein